MDLFSDGVQLLSAVKNIFKPTEDEPDGPPQLNLLEQGARVGAFKAVMSACGEKKLVGKLAKDAVSLLLDEVFPSETGFPHGVFYSCFLSSLHFQSRYMVILPHKPSNSSRA